MGKGAILIAIGLFIDALQAMVSFVCFTLGATIGTVGGAVGGAVAGAKVCGFAGSTIASACATAGGAVGGFLGSFANPALASVGIPLGIVLGFALNVCISLTIGAGFIALLSLNGMFYPVYLWSAFVGEAIPGLDDLPGWTALAILCTLRKMREESSGVSGLVARAASAVISPQNAVGLVGSAISGVSAVKQEVSGGVRRTPAVQNLYETNTAQAATQSRQNLRATVGQELRSAPRPSSPAYASNQTA